LATAPGSLNWKSRISTHIERDLAKLFLDGALVNKNSTQSR